MPRVPLACSLVFMAGCYASSKPNVLVTPAGTYEGPVVHGMLLAAMGSSSAHGVYVRYVVPRSVAAQSGVQTADWLEAVDDRKVKSVHQAVALFAEANSARRCVVLRVRRGDSVLALQCFNPEISAEYAETRRLMDLADHEAPILLIIINSKKDLWSELGWPPEQFVLLRQTTLRMVHDRVLSAGDQVSKVCTEVIGPRDRLGKGSCSGPRDVDWDSLSMGVSYKIVIYGAEERSRRFLASTPIADLRLRGILSVDSASGTERIIQVTDAQCSQQASVTIGDFIGQEGYSVLSASNACVILASGEATKRLCVTDTCDP
jgi:hypothetical protein